MFLDGGNSIGDRHDLYFDFNLEIAYCLTVFHSWNPFFSAPSVQKKVIFYDLKFVKKNDVLSFKHLLAHRKSACFHAAHVN